jgi:hypothetical protein
MPTHAQRSMNELMNEKKKKNKIKTEWIATKKVTKIKKKMLWCIKIIYERESTSKSSLSTSCGRIVVFMVKKNWVKALVTGIKYKMTQPNDSDSMGIY